MSPETGGVVPPGATPGSQRGSAATVVSVDPDVASPARAGDFARAGAAAFTAGDFEGARQHYEAALEEWPDDAQTLNDVGQALVRLGDVSGAIVNFERAVRLAPAKWAYRFNLAHAAGLLSQWERAIADYHEAATLFPTDYATQFDLVNRTGFLGDLIAWEDGVYGTFKSVFSGGARACRSDGRGAPGGPRISVGGAAVGGTEARLHGGDAAEVGAAGAA